MVEMARRGSERSGSGVDPPRRFGAVATTRTPPPFDNGTSCRSLPQDQDAFLKEEIARLKEKGVLRAIDSSSWVSRAFLVPKPGGWRLIIDLRTINENCQKRSMKMETLRHLRLIAKPGDHWVSFDLKDGFYALAIHPKDRKYFTVNLNGQLLHLCALPMGWSLSPYVFQKLTDVFVNKLRDPEATAAAGKTSKSKRRWVRRRRRLSGARLLPFVDDFALFAKSFAAAMELKEVTFSLLNSLGLQIHPTKGHHIATMMGDHLGMTLDFAKNEFRAPEKKLKDISISAKQLLVKSTANKRWVPVKSLASLAGKAQFLHLAIPVARFYLRELHDIVKTATSWSSTVRVSKQLKRDLEWWQTVPNKHNGAPIFKAVETAYLHCDSSGFGWGAVLNDCIEARGFWTGADKEAHITFKKLKAVRCAIESFLPELKGRRLLLHEDNQSVVGVLTHLT